jgi:hypothetical protein
MIPQVPSRFAIAVFATMLALSTMKIFAMPLFCRARKASEPDIVPLPGSP